MRKAKRAFFLFLSAACTIALNTGMLYAADITGKVTTNKLKSPEGILVYIEKVEGKDFAPSKEPAVMDQIALVFTPRVLPVLKGTTVEFHNSDDVLHNVFAVGDYDFDLGTWGKGGAKSYTFDKLGEAAILCNVHPEMEAYIVVLQNPYFALTDKNGIYKIEGVPQGAYTLKTWNDRLRPVTKEVEVSAGETKVDFDIKR